MDDEMFQSSLAARLKVYEPDGAVSYLHLETAGESDSMKMRKFLQMKMLQKTGMIRLRVKINLIVM
mgnify:CR=1 FL=1